MAETSPNLFELLLESVEQFNAFRLANLGVPVELKGADLRGANLRQAFLAGAQLDGAQLDDAALSGAALAGASLAGASLRRADLRRALFGRAELIESHLAFSPVGPALLRGASLRGASLEAARAEEAVFIEADLSEADLTDCDLTGAQLKGAQLSGSRQGPPPPSAGDGMAALARLALEPLPVRLDLALFAGMVFITGAKTPDDQQFVSAIAQGMGLTQADISAVMPHGAVRLETVKLQPPASQWARRVYFALMCGLASSAPPSDTQLKVLGHFGAQLGFCDRAMARIASEELGMSIRSMGQA
jgi:uncharacterized protein YjbI with pentapeptide repeats